MLYHKTYFKHFTEGNNIKFNQLIQFESDKLKYEFEALQVCMVFLVPNEFKCRAMLAFIFIQENGKFTVKSFCFPSVKTNFF